VDVRRIAFVTQRFQELQGLRTVADALPALLLAAGLYRTHSYLHVIILFGALAAYFVARTTWIPSRLEAYYSRRLGRVDPIQPDVDATLLFARFSQPRRVHPSGPNSEGTFLFYQGLLLPMYGGPLPVAVQIPLVASMLGFQALWILIRDWRYRGYWVLPLVVGVSFALRLGTVTSARELHEWQALACLCSGVSLAIAGVCDHLLLVKSLGGGSRATSAVEYVDNN
jgi:hypothetical protein